MFLKFLNLIIRLNNDEFKNVLVQAMVSFYNFCLNIDRFKGLHCRLYSLKFMFIY